MTEKGLSEILQAIHNGRIRFDQALGTLVDDNARGQLFDHLDVTCSEEYIEKCSQILFETSPSITRHTVVWNKEQILRVTTKMKKV